MNEPVPTRRSFLGLGLAAAGALTVPSLLSSCSTTVNPSTSASAGAVSMTGTLRVGWVSEPDLLNPFTFSSTAAGEVLMLIYDNLLMYDEQLKPAPGLATKATYSADGKDITYTLRTGVTWHDGKPFTADDVKFTWDTIAKNNLGQAAQYLPDLISVDIVDPTTVVAHFKKPQAFDPALIIPIVPKHVWGTMDAAAIQKYSNDTPVGTGPYTFGQWKQGQFVEVDRYESWWGTKPAAAKVTWVHYDSADVMTQSLVAGSVDVLTEVPPTLWDGLARQSSIAAVELKSYSFHHIGMNVSDDPNSGGNPLLRDKVVRQALSLGLDRSQLVKLALAGHGIPGSVLLPSAFGDWQATIPESDRLDANPAKAQQILDDAGYTKGSDGIRVAPNGKPLSFRLIAIQATDVDVRAAQLFVAAAQAIGIKLTLQTLDETTLGNIVYNSDAPNWDLFVWGWDSSTPDPDYLLGVPLTSQIGNNNDVYYSNPAYDSLYEEQATTLDDTTRHDLVHQMQTTYYQDAAYIVMWYQSKLQAYRKNGWKGWVQVPGGMVFNFTRSNYLTVTPSA